MPKWRKSMVPAAGLLAFSLAVPDLTVPAMAATSEQAWVEMAPGGGSIVRVVTGAPSCPTLVVDTQTVAMTPRAGPGVLPPRTNKAGGTTGSAFPSLVCELPLPRQTRHAILNHRSLPLPHRRIDRIVVIGDTGCRLKITDNAWQDCDVPTQWPFAAIAARAAALHPDLVLHVGDYLYRENPCPADHPGCARTDWGYGETGWRADFLAPAAPLLASAPWAMVRGNHEECSRAGQGWWRLLDPHALVATHDCGDPANDAAGNHSDPYAVELGGNARLIVADLIALASGSAADPETARTFAGDMAIITALSSNGGDTFLTAHYPVNPVVWENGKTSAVAIGSKPINAFGQPPLAGVRAMIAGHIHLFQYAAFADRPRQVIAGFSGTMEDAAIAPASLAQTRDKPGAAPLTALTTITGRFGYALLERKRDGWRLTAFAEDGAVMGRYPL